jgi:hypothetical protein
MSCPSNYPPSHVFQLRNERKIHCFLSDDHCDLFPLASLSWKHGMKDSWKDSSPVHARANSSQYIHHTFFASPPCSKLDAMPVQCTLYKSCLWYRNESKTNLRSSKFFVIGTKRTSFYHNFFKIKAERIFDPRNFRFWNETNHLILELFKIEAK